MTADLVVQMTPVSEPQAVLDSLSELARSRHPRKLQVDVNAGALAAALLRRCSKADKGENLVVQGLTLAGEDLPGVELRRVTFSRVRLDRVDLRGARFLECEAQQLSLEGVLVDRSSTRLELAGLKPGTDVLGLQYEEGGLLDLTFDPDKLSEILRSIGVIQDTDIGPRFPVREEILDRIEHIGRAFRRANPLGTNHTRFGSLFTDDLGAQIMPVLLSAGLLAIDSPRQTSGPAQTFYRKRFDEAELLGALTAESTNPAVEQAWRDLSRL